MKTAKYLSFGALAALIVMMMAATVVEKLQGTPSAFRLVYHNPVFMVLWALAMIIFYANERMIQDYFAYLW
jgi:hypothetical protein